MNCFMGYNPLATKQAKVTVWVCEQDGATPVAPSNPSAGDCFIVYATDEAVLSNTPTSAKTYADGKWKDAEGGGGGATFPTFTNDGEAWSCNKTYDECLEMCESLTSLDQPSYPCLQVASGTTAFNIMLVVEDVGICVYLFETALTYHSDGTITEE